MLYLNNGLRTTLSSLPSVTGHVDAHRADNRGCGRLGSLCVEIPWRGASSSECRTVATVHIHWLDTLAGRLRRRALQGRKKGLRVWCTKNCYATRPAFPGPAG